MKRYFAVTLLALALMRAEPAAAVAIWSFDTIPVDGALTGIVGDTVGWGFVVTNDDSRFLQFDGFVSPTSSLALITDLFLFPTLAPFSSVTVPYVPGTDGLAEALLQAAGSESGPLFKFTVTASFYDLDPDQNPGQLAGDTEGIDALVSLTVFEPRVTATPEPAAVILLAAGIGALAVTRRLVPLALRGGKK